MLTFTASDMSDYVASLDYTARKRYLEEVEIDVSSESLKDPYLIVESQSPIAVDRRYEKMA